MHTMTNHLEVNMANDIKSPKGKDTLCFKHVEAVKTHFVDWETLFQSGALKLLRTL